MSEDNDTPFRVIDGGRNVQRLPQDEYLIVDMSGNEHFAQGFMTYTNSHVAIMKDIGNNGAIPVFMMPLTNVFSAELYVEDEVFGDEVSYDSED